MALHIRAFDGTRRDAQGIIDVDAATFGDCQYGPEYIVNLQSDPQQHAWVAEDAGQIVGFVSAFPTHSLGASRWEVDELAVLPRYQGRGLGTELVAQALEEGSRLEGLSEARALVASNNVPSQRVFIHNGFTATAEVHLLSHQITGRVPRPQRANAPSVHRAGPADAPGIARLTGCTVTRAAACLRRPDNLYLLVRRGEEILGCAEMVHVRTLQYEGFWIESVSISHRGGAAVLALFNASIEEAKRHMAMDRVGYLAMRGERVLYTAAVREGFGKVVDYLAFVQEFHKR
jgi:ribosomal protein S18 acetylase RimI-like enzyme